jgi:hypothetical protein
MATSYGLVTLTNTREIMKIKHKKGFLTKKAQFDALESTEQTMLIQRATDAVKNKHLLRIRLKLGLYMTEFLSAYQYQLYVENGTDAGVIEPELILKFAK